jgi:transketolase
MDRLMQLIEHGQSYWLDTLSRDIIESGELGKRVHEHGLRGVTSNPNTLNQAISGGSRAYDAQIEEAALEGRSTKDIYELLTTTDVRNACDVLRAVYDESEGRDGFVSLEVSPHLAYDTDGTVAEARRLWQTVDRPNLLIKVPGTKAGVPAIEELLYEGINVNVTLLFSIPSYEAVAQAHMRAFERRHAEGKPIYGIASVASFFLSRIDVLTDTILAQHVSPRQGPEWDPKPKELQGEVALANAKLAYQSFKRLNESDRWHALAQNGARPQRMLWASTSTKNPDYSDVMYVEPLIGPHTVNTMPTETIFAFGDHGRVADTVEEGVDEARRVMDALQRLEIDYDRIAQQLEIEGVEKFNIPYDTSMATVDAKRRMVLNRRDAGPLRQMADKLRRECIRMTTEAGSGHATSSLSCADIVSALYFNHMRWDPSDPKARNVDTFVLSKGHASPILWSALSEAGAINEDIMSLRRIDSTLEGHPTPNNPWVRVATGSLGQGLAAANGIALANRLDGLQEARVYCLLGDAECSEGSVWEAAQFASLQKLHNLVAIVDVNALGQSGPAPYEHNTAVLAQRFKAFGWQTLEIDGHDIEAVLDALQRASRKGPTAIVARTVKGKGVSFLEGAFGWHGKALDPEQAERALQELQGTDIHLTVQPRRVGEYRRPEYTPPAPLTPEYPLGEEEATRTAFGNALKKLGGSMPQLVVLDGDVKNSTRTQFFAEAYPERFFEGYIAEQNMTGAALGLAVSDKVPVAASFACFLSRAYDFIRMAGHTRPDHLVFCGSHAGISIGQDGPSQMGLEDMAMFRSLYHSTVLYPSDAVSAERLTREAVTTDGIVYLRTTRSKTPIIYGNDESFPVGGSKTLRSGDQDAITLVAAGITLHEALAAHDSLREKGVQTRVIDAYSVKPLDVETMQRAARETGAIVVVEDHWPEGGLGGAVAEAVAGRTAVHQLAVSGEPRSGKPEELMDRYGISRHAIERKVMELVG